MDLTLPALLTRVRDTIADPRGGARAIIALQVPARIGWAAVGLMAVVSTLFTYASIRLSPPETQALFAEALSSPLRTAFLQMFVLVAACFAIWRMGRARGGQGSMDDTLALVAWLQFVMLVLQVIAMAVQVLVPPLAGIIGIAELVLFFWLLVNFVTELHGFRSRAATFAGIVLAMVLLIFLMALVLMPVMGT